MEVVGTQVYQAGQTDPSFQLTAMQTARAHVIGLFGSAAEMVSLMRAAYGMGMYGKLYQYFSFWSLMDAGTWTDPVTGALMKVLHVFQSNMESSYVS